jgi:hypothetical protein
MSNEQKNRLVTREALLSLLTDAEIAKVSRAESGPLVEGDEYVDLDDPAAGIRQVHDKSPRPGRALPRSAVSDATWTKVIRALS